MGDRYALYEETTDPLSKQEELELFTQLKRITGSQRTMLVDRIVRANLRYVVKSADRLVRLGLLSRDDLVAEGYVGLMEAIDRYDPERGYRFITYASRLIWQAMLWAMWNENWINFPKHWFNERLRLLRLQRDLEKERGQPIDLVELADELPSMDKDAVLIFLGEESRVVSLNSPAQSLCSDLESSGEFGPMNIQEVIAVEGDGQEGDLDDKELAARLAKALDELDWRTAYIIRNYYGLDGSDQDLVSIGDNIGLSGSSIGGMKREGLEQMRKNPALQSLIGDGRCELSA